MDFLTNRNAFDRNAYKLQTSFYQFKKESYKLVCAPVTSGLRDKRSLT